jgi:hypothetical protein
MIVYEKKKVNESKEEEGKREEKKRKTSVYEIKYFSTLFFRRKIKFVYYLQTTA